MFKFSFILGLCIFQIQQGPRDHNEKIYYFLPGCDEDYKYSYQNKELVTPEHSNLGSLICAEQFMTIQNDSRVCVYHNIPYGNDAINGVPQQP